MAGSISSAGLGSGLDVPGIIDKLMSLERQPLAKIQSQQTRLQTQLSAFGQIQSLTSAFKDALAPLMKADSYSQMSATSADSAAVAVTAKAGAVAGTYNVKINSVAAGQTLVSPAGQFADENALAGEGKLTIRLGEWSADKSTFTPKIDSTDIVLDIGPPAESLAKVRDKINAANAGVTATLVKDASGTRLSLVSVGTGLNSGFRISVQDVDANNTDDQGLSRLAFDPATAANGLTMTQSAANTTATINGIDVSSTSNTLDDVIPGLSIKANKVTDQPVALTVNRNNDALKGYAEKFVSAFNGLNSFINQMTGYNAEKKEGGLLQGDRTAVGMMSQLRQIVGGNGTGSEKFQNLSSIGIEFQKDGSLKLDSAKFAKAMENPSELAKVFMPPAGSPGAANGVMKNLTAWADQMLGDSGSLKGKSKSIEGRIAAVGRDATRYEKRLTQVEDRLRAQYTKLDTTISKAKALQSYVSQQMTMLQNSR